MKAIEYQYSDGTFSFEWVHLTHGENKRMAGKRGDDLIAHIRQNAEIVKVVQVDLTPTAHDDDELIVDLEY